MDILSELEVRILACLVEKQVTTPEYYPLTLNALVNACNQKSNRHPIMTLGEKEVVRGLDRLREKKLARVVHLAGSRVPKYEHSFSEVVPLDDAEMAVVCELMLRGPQTLGELRSRASRFHRFESIDEVQRVVESLQEGNRLGPLVLKLPRQVGRKESRFAHLLAGPPEVGEDAGVLPAEEATLQVREENERIKVLEEAVAKLQDEVRELRTALDDFRAQFD